MSLRFLILRLAGNISDRAWNAFVTTLVLVAVVVFAFWVGGCGQTEPEPDDGGIRMEVEWSLSSFIPRQGSDSLPRIYLDGTTDHPFVVDGNLEVDYKSIRIVNVLNEEWHVLWFCSTELMNGREVEVNGNNLGPMGSSHSWCPSEGLGSDGVPFTVRVEYPVVAAWCRDAGGDC